MWFGYRRMRELMDERDRRYAEVARERDRALEIKDRGDATALELARDIQTYKDEQHNGLLRQIERERAGYATVADLRALSDKIDALIKPLADYMAGQQGASRGAATLWGVITVAAVIAVGVLALVLS